MNDLKAFVIGATVGSLAMSILIYAAIVGAKDEIIQQQVMYHDGKEYDVIPSVIPCQPHK